MEKYTLYIDEVGRGSIAGPVLTAGILVSNNKKLKYKYFDSKELSLSKRELLFEKIKYEDVEVFTGIASNKEVDKYGVNYALSISVKRMLNKIKNYPDKIVLDGNYNYIKLATKKYNNVDCIVKGDKYNNFLSCASIYAKVTRDKLMIKYSEKFPNYNFDKNKGYGTENHYLSIEKFGLSDLHRITFIKKQSS
jgi:ribonuclease HII